MFKFPKTSAQKWTMICNICHLPFLIAIVNFQCQHWAIVATTNPNLAHLKQVLHMYLDADTPDVITYRNVLLYVNPIKGKWFPANAFGSGKVSFGPSSFSISSKLLVSTSLDSSGTTGGTAATKQTYVSTTDLYDLYLAFFSINLYLAFFSINYHCLNH